MAAMALASALPAPAASVTCPPLGALTVTRAALTGAGGMVSMVKATLAGCEALPA